MEVSPLGDFVERRGRSSHDQQGGKQGGGVSWQHICAAVPATLPGAD